MQQREVEWEGSIMTQALAKSKALAKALVNPEPKILNHTPHTLNPKP